MSMCIRNLGANLVETENYENLDEANSMFLLIPLQFRQQTPPAFADFMRTVFRLRVRVGVLGMLSRR
jgi:hypothetical protein